MANTLPESAAITTNELVGFIIYIIFFTPLMLVHPTKYHKYLWCLDSDYGRTLHLGRGGEWWCIGSRTKERNFRGVRSA